MYRVGGVRCISLRGQPQDAERGLVMEVVMSVTTCSVKCRVTIILCQVARLLSGGCAYFAWSGAGAGDLSLNTARLAREEGGAEADYLANKVTRLY